MLFPETTGIRVRRLRLNLGQKELAAIAGISQSLIAKLESGKIEPSYAIAKKIFMALESLENNSGKKCSDIMTPRVLSVRKSDKIGKAVDIMKKHSIDQLPVLDGKRVVGLLSESILFNNINDKTPKSMLFESSVEAIMVGPPPIVNANLPSSVVLPMLKVVDAILVEENQKLTGIITKTNLL